MIDTSDFRQMALNALRLGAILLAVYVCYRIVEPFIPLVLLGAIIAITIHPTHQKLTARLGNRSGWSATLITLLAIAILVAPTLLLAQSVIETTKALAADISEGSLEVAPPPEHVRGWPLVGRKIHSSWSLASKDPDAAAERMGPQLEALRSALIATAGGAGGAFLQMLLSVIIGGAFLAAAETTVKGSRALMLGFIGERGSVMLEEATTTIRSVAHGVLGVAVIESMLAAVGLVVAGIPAPGLWTLLVLMLSIVQVPPLLLLIPLAVYAVSTASTLGATVFVICALLAILVDTLLKPVLLGRTADAPMLIVLMGAIGGMMLWGITGLFVGAVVLVVCWEGLQFWVVRSD